MNAFEPKNAGHSSAGNIAIGSDLDSDTPVFWGDEASARGDGRGRGSDSEDAARPRRGESYSEVSQWQAWRCVMKDIVRAAKFSELWPGFFLLTVGLTIFLVENLAVAKTH